MSAEREDSHVAPRSQYLDPTDPANPRRAILYLNLQAAAADLPADQYEVFDLVVMGNRTMTEAGEELGIPRMTAMDRYKAALASVRRAIKNDPGVRLLFEALVDLFEERR